MGRIYSISEKPPFDSDKLLQIDSYCDKKQYELSVRLVRVEKGENATYVAKRNIEVGDTFNSLRLSASDFKHEKTLSPMPDWKGIKALVIIEKNIVIGKIMFV